MKTLKESILADVEDTLQAGDDIVKNLKVVIKRVRRELTSIKKYRIYTCDAVGRFDIKDFGLYGADTLTINIHRNEYLQNIMYTTGYEWFFNIGLYDANYKALWISKFRIDNDKKLTFKDIVKGVFADATKDENTFIRFLANIKKLDGQTVTNINDLLK